MGEGGLPVGRVGGGRAACPTRVAGWLLCHPLTSISLFFRPSAFGARPEVGRTTRPACAGAVSGTRRDGIAMSALCAALASVPPPFQCVHILHVVGGSGRLWGAFRREAAADRVPRRCHRHPRDEEDPRPLWVPRTWTPWRPPGLCLFCSVWMHIVNTVQCQCCFLNLADSIDEPGRGDTSDCPVSQLRDVLSVSLFTACFYPPPPQAYGIP